MGVERGDLVNLGQRKVHLVGQGHEMTGVKAAEMVLQQMEMLDQQIGATLAVTEQRRDLGERGGVDLAALRMVRTAPPPGPWMDAPIVS